MVTLGQNEWYMAPSGTINLVTLMPGISDFDNNNKNKKLTLIINNCYVLVMQSFPCFIIFNPLTDFNEVHMPKYAYFRQEVSKTWKE